MAITLLLLNGFNFQFVFIAGKRSKFSTKLIQYFTLHHHCVAALPCQSYKFEFAVISKKQSKNRVTFDNKNLSIANRSRVSCAHNTLRTLRASIGINITP